MELEIKRLARKKKGEHYFGRTMPLKGRFLPVGDMTLKAESRSSGPDDDGGGDGGGGIPPVQRSEGFWLNRLLNMLG
jgi:hypothetical protein